MVIDLILCLSFFLRLRYNTTRKNLEIHKIERRKKIQRMDVDMGKIAVIDSGIGGLTVAKEIIKLMPNEEIVYFGDQKNCPYGDKTEHEIKTFVYDMIHFLEQYELKALVIACNTATSFLLEELQQRLPYPVVGVIEPGAAYALDETKNKKIGVIATVKTIESEAYRQTLQKIDAEAVVYSQACSRLASLIESPNVTYEALHLALEEYLFPLKNKGIDTLILGCTHYPLIVDQIKQFVGKDVVLIDPAIRTATELQRILAEHQLFASSVRTENHLFFTSGDAKSFSEKTKRWLGFSIVAQHKKEASNKEGSALS